MNLFKTQRESLDKTQLDIAVEMGMTPSAVSAWEREEAVPRLSLAAKLAQVYQLTEEAVVAEILRITQRRHAAVA